MILLRIFRALGSSLGSLAYWAGVRKDVTLQNLALAMPELSERERSRVAHESFRNIGLVFAEFLYLRFVSKRVLLESLEVENPEVALEAEREGCGVIVLSGHIANWEWIAVSLGLHIDRSFRLVVKNQRSRIADRFLTRMRDRFGNTKVDAGDVRAIFAALNRKEFLAILGDQAAPATSLRVPFFGVPVPTFEGVARLALRSRAPVLFLHNARTQGGYSCRFERIEYSDIAERDVDAVQRLTERHTAVLERSIRRRPELWVWQHKRWKDAAR